MSSRRLISCSSLSRRSGPFIWRRSSRRWCSCFYRPPTPTSEAHDPRGGGRWPERCYADQAQEGAVGGWDGLSEVRSLPLRGSASRRYLACRMLVGELLTGWHQKDM